MVHISAPAEVQAQILTDAVEDDDGIVDGITNDGQERRNEGRINLALGEGEDRQHDEDIVHQGQHRRNAEAELEAVSHIGDDKGPGYHQSQHSIGDELAADGSPHLLLTHHRIGANLLLDAGHDSLALLFLHIRGTDHDILALGDTALSPGELDGAALQAERSQALAHLGDGHRLVKFQINDGTASEVDTEVEAPHSHAEEAGNDDKGRDEEPDFPMPCNIKLRHWQYPPSVRDACP